MNQQQVILEILQHQSAILTKLATLILKDEEITTITPPEEIAEATPIVVSASNANGDLFAERGTVYKRDYFKSINLGRSYESDKIHNRRKIISISLYGEPKTYKEISEETGLSYEQVRLDMEVLRQLNDHVKKKSVPGKKYFVHWIQKEVH